MTDTCPRCTKPYGLCDCIEEQAATTEPITGRVVFRAACQLQRLRMPITTGAIRPDGIERHIDTGKVDPSPGPTTLRRR